MENRSKDGPLSSIRPEVLGECTDENVDELLDRYEFELATTFKVFMMEARAINMTKEQAIENWRSMTEVQE